MRMSVLWTPGIFERLGGVSSVLIAGAGGGFDVYAGLPIYFALRDSGVTAHPICRAVGVRIRGAAGEALTARKRTTVARSVGSKARLGTM